MTDGTLLQELQSDQYLSKYSVIMVDEAHERSLNIDFTLGLLKQILEMRKDFKGDHFFGNNQRRSFFRIFRGSSRGPYRLRKCIPSESSMILPSKRSAGMNRCSTRSSKSSAGY